MKQLTDVCKIKLINILRENKTTKQYGTSEQAFNNIHTTQTR